MTKKMCPCGEPITGRSTVCHRCWELDVNDDPVLEEQERADRWWSDPRWNPDLRD